MHKDFSDDAWADYTYWIMQDKKDSQENKPASCRY